MRSYLSLPKLVDMRRVCKKFKKDIDDYDEIKELTTFLRNVVTNPFRKTSYRQLWEYIINHKGGIGAAKEIIPLTITTLGYNFIQFAMNWCAKSGKEDLLKWMFLKYAVNVNCYQSFDYAFFSNCWNTMEVLLNSIQELNTIPVISVDANNFNTVQKFTLEAMKGIGEPLSEGDIAPFMTWFEKTRESSLLDITMLKHWILPLLTKVDLNTVKHLFGLKKFQTMVRWEFLLKEVIKIDDNARRGFIVELVKHLRTLESPYSQNQLLSNHTGGHITWAVYRKRDEIIAMLKPEAKPLDYFCGLCRRGDLKLVEEYYAQNKEELHNENWTIPLIAALSREEKSIIDWIITKRNEGHCKIDQLQDPEILWPSNIDQGYLSGILKSPRKGVFKKIKSFVKSKK